MNIPSLITNRTYLKLPLTCKSFRSVSCFIMTYPGLTLSDVFLDEQSLVLEMSRSRSSTAGEI